MRNRLIFLTVLALMIAGTAFCELSEMTKIPASQDVSITFGNESGVYNTDTLICDVSKPDINSSKNISFSVPMIQFNISGINMTENDIGILVLKIESMKSFGNDSPMIAVMPVESGWNENTSYHNLYFRLEPAFNIVESFDITKLGVSTDHDNTVVFDVSRKLLEAKANGGKVSFLLMAISNSTYSVDFKSRETGEGPYLIVMPYPTEARAGNAISMPSNESAANQTKANSTAINNTAIKSIVINSSSINNTAANQTKANKIVINNTAIANTSINQATANKTAINQTANMPSESAAKNMNSSAMVPSNNSTTNKTAIKMEMMNATMKNNTENATKHVAA